MSLTDVTSAVDKGVGWLTTSLAAGVDLLGALGVDAAAAALARRVEAREDASARGAGEVRVGRVARRHTDAGQAAHAAAQTLPEIPIDDLYQVLVQCRDEAQQRTLFTRLTEEGWQCRVLTL